MRLWRRREVRPTDIPEPRLLDAAWGVIANVNGGNWLTADPEWREAAIQWRKDYHRWLDERRT